MVSVRTLRAATIVLAALLTLTAVALAPVYAASGPSATLSEIPSRVPVSRPSNQPSAPRQFTLIGSGDVLLHESVWAQARRDATGGRTYDFGPIFAGVAPLVAQADVAICHFETPVGEPDGPFSGYPSFNVPPQVVTTLAELGYDSCSTASNHSLDMGVAGVTRTLDALDAAGIVHAGTARSAVEHASPTLVRAGDVVVGHLSYTASFNGIPRPAGKPWIANPIDVAEIAFEARLARLAGAQVVVVSLHVGTEYQHAANAYQISLANQLLANPDIDLILGSHAHVVQPLENINGKWVAYGMGNQVSWQSQSYVTRDGIMPRFTFTEASPGVFRVTRVEVVPIHMWLDGAPARLYDVSAVLQSPSAPATIRSACAASLQRTRSVLGQRGAYDAGMVLLGDSA